MEDDQGRLNATKVTVAVTSSDGENVYPTATNDNVTANGSGEVTIDVLTNDTGLGLVLNAPNAWSLKGGAVSLAGNKLVYTSKVGFTGSDNIWYVMVDAQGRKNSAQVKINVTP